MTKIKKFINTIHFSLNKISNKIKQNSARIAHLFIFVVAMVLAARQAKALAYSKDVGVSSRNAVCSYSPGENSSKYRKKNQQIDVSTTKEYVNISNLCEKPLPHNFSFSDNLNHEKIINRENFLLGAKNKPKISCHLITETKKPIFPKIIQPLSVDIFIEELQPDTLTCIKKRKTVSTQHLSEILLCSNFFISVLKANAASVSQIKSKKIETTALDINFNQNIQNKTQNKTKKTRKKHEDNILILKILHPLRKNDLIICCEKNHENVPIGAVGKVVDIISSKQAKCKFILAEGWLFFTPKQQKILVNYASQTVGTGLFATPHFLESIKIKIL